MPSSKSRNFDCVLYLPVDVLRDKLQELWPKIDWYAYIVHDRDYLDPSHPDDGTKKWHIHLVLRTKSPLNQRTVKNWFYYRWVNDQDEVIEEKCIVQTCYNPVGACRYLMHLDHKEKFQYERREVHTNKEDFDRFLELDDSGDDIIRECVTDILNGWSIQDITEKYGKIFVMYRRQIMQTVQDLKTERNSRARFFQYTMEVLINDYRRDYERYHPENRLKICDVHGADPKV